MMIILFNILCLTVAFSENKRRFNIFKENYLTDLNWLIENSNFSGGWWHNGIFWLFNLLLLTRGQATENRQTWMKNMNNVVTPSFWKKIKERHACLLYNNSFENDFQVRKKKKKRLYHHIQRNFLKMKTSVLCFHRH